MIDLRHLSRSVYSILMGRYDQLKGLNVVCSYVVILNDSGYFCLL